MNISEFTLNCKKFQIKFSKIKKRLQSCFTLDCKYQLLFKPLSGAAVAAEHPCSLSALPRANNWLHRTPVLAQPNPSRFPFFSPFTVKNGTQGKTEQTENGTKTNGTRKIEKNSRYTVDWWLGKKSLSILPPLKILWRKKRKRDRNERNSKNRKTAVIR